MLASLETAQWWSFACSLGFKLYVTCNWDQRVVRWMRSSEEKQEIAITSIVGIILDPHSNQSLIDRRHFCLLNTGTQSYRQSHSWCTPQSLLLESLFSCFSSPFATDSKMDKASYDLCNALSISSSGVFCCSNIWLYSLHIPTILRSLRHVGCSSRNIQYRHSSTCLFLNPIFPPLHVLHCPFGHPVNNILLLSLITHLTLPTNREV